MQAVSRLRAVPPVTIGRGTAAPPVLKSVFLAAVGVGEDLRSS